MDFMAKKPQNYHKMIFNKCYSDSVPQMLAHNSNVIDIYA